MDPEALRAVDGSPPAPVDAASPGPSAEPLDGLAPAAGGDHTPPAPRDGVPEPRFAAAPGGSGSTGLERDDMAWPPAPWERAPSQWRDDLWGGAEPFQPYDVPPAPVAEAATPARRPGTRLMREFVETIALTLLIFLGIKLVVQNFKIQGASMEPTLHDGQFLLVNKLVYQGLGEPQRGDIVVFKAWEQGGGVEERDFIKRVVGLPGDTLEIRDNSVFVNGQTLGEPYLEPSNLTTDRIGPITLGPEEYYVMGDNRGNSSDSRTYGPLDQEHIIGKAWLSYWPPGDIGVVPDSDSSFALTKGG
jgi:signal peptidase I